MADWFRVSGSTEKTRITFVPSCDRFWQPDVLKEAPLPREKMGCREIVLDGPGAIWMYAHASALASKEGAGKVTAVRKGYTNAVANCFGCRCELLPANGPIDARLLYVTLRANPPVTESAVRQLLDPQLDELRRQPPRDLVLAGRAGVDFYAIAAYTAVKVRVRRIFCWSARDGLVLVYNEENDYLGRCDRMPSWLEKHFPKPDPGVVIGVAGDPHRGKSVFSRVLDWFREEKGIDGWMLDCDGQSPTPHWYLTGLNSTVVREVNQLRRQCKRNWTPRMEELIASQLRRGRRWFSVLIADLPGGKHNPGNPERIPRGREKIFSEIDALILLDDEKNTTEQLWREALSTHGLESRIAVVLRSSSPDRKPASLVIENSEDTCRGCTSGLERGRNLKELGQELQDSLEEIWKAVMARS
ncbi:hypothetical protein JCM19992_19060 [Thermostilla marina]